MTRSSRTVSPSRRSPGNRCTTYRRADTLSDPQVSPLNDLEDRAIDALEHSGGTAGSACFSLAKMSQHGWHTPRVPERGLAGERGLSLLPLGAFGDAAPCAPPIAKCGSGRLTKKLILSDPAAAHARGAAVCAPRSAARGPPPALRRNGAPPPPAFENRSICAAFRLRSAGRHSVRSPALRTTCTCAVSSSDTALCAPLCLKAHFDDPLLLLLHDLASFSTPIPLLPSRSPPQTARAKRAPKGGVDGADVAPIALPHARFGRVILAEKPCA